MIRDEDVPLPDPHPLVRVLGPEDPFLAGALAVPACGVRGAGHGGGEAGTGELATEITARAAEVPAAAWDPHPRGPHRTGRGGRERRRGAPGCTCPSAA